MIFRGSWRRLKVALARMHLWRRRASVYPVFLYRDAAQGDVDQGALLVGGKFRFAHQIYSLPLRGAWDMGWPEDIRRWFYGFSWLRDLRALGTNEARLIARSLIASWSVQAPEDPIAFEGGVLGMRLASWMGHYEFALSTATEETQHIVMGEVLGEGRILAASLPLEANGWEGLSALRGLLAAFMALPDQRGFFSRYQRYLPVELNRLIFADGTVVERSPEAQFQCAHELVSMLNMFAGLNLVPPAVIPDALRRVCSVLRAFCHGDGGLALFNGSYEHSTGGVHYLLEQAGAL